MKTAISVLFLLATACGGAASSSTMTATNATSLQYENASEAAGALMELMGMDVMLTQSIELMLEAQIQGNPQLAKFKPVMMEFMNRYMSWKALADEITQLYADAYTHSELEELIAFYKTPLGTKSIRLVPELMKQGAEIGVRRVQENMPQLQKMLIEAKIGIESAESE